MDALIERLDQLPASEAQIKVFEIRNGDATALAEMLQNLFGVAGSWPISRRVPARARPRRAATAPSCRCGSRSINAPTASSPRATRAI